MAPLLPSESGIYLLDLPSDSIDPRETLDVRTGAALTFTRSAVVVHGGLVLGIGLPHATIPAIEDALRFEGADHDWNSLVSAEMFYLNIVNRCWVRVPEAGAGSSGPRPRLSHSLAFSGRSIYMFGGLVVDESGKRLIPTNELWEFNIDTRLWTCFDAGNSSGTVSRYAHTLLHVVYESPDDHKSHPCLAMVGGRGELNQELMHISIYDLTKRQYINTTEMQLTLNELKPRAGSVASSVDPRLPSQGQRSKLKASRETSFVIAGTSDVEADVDAANDTLFVMAQDETTDALRNPIVALPVVPNASGIRLSVAGNVSKNSSVLPRSLRRPTGGMFGANIIVSGTNTTRREYEVYLYNRPSEKWCRLNTAGNAADLYLWQSLSWHSHHKVIVLGSRTLPKGAEYATVQKFDMLLLIGLPVINIFHALTQGSSTTTNTSFSHINKSTNFEAYSRYVAPSSNISSIRSVFPSYAVTLGRNAFERFGPSLSDFEFISAEGFKVNVPLMLLRKRWGRCFDMLLSKSYARAVYRLEHAKDGNDDNDSVASSGKKSVIMLNKALLSQDRDLPQFRLPFQERLSGTNTPIPGLEPQSRKASVVSSNSIITTSTSELPEIPGMDSIPPMQPQPLEPLPPLDTKAPLKSFNSRDNLRESPRESLSGSVSGASMTIPHPTLAPSATKMRELKSSVSTLKKRVMSTSSSSPPENDDYESAESVHESKELLEPLLIPRSLYLPFPTPTVQALAEFLFTGQLGDKWLLTPTTTDTLLAAKFYELPLLYDLVSEVLYAMIGKKENQLMRIYSDLLGEFNGKLNAMYRHQQQDITNFFNARPHIHAFFEEVETYLDTVDDGYLNLNMLRNASKVSSTASTRTQSGKNSFDIPRRRSSARTRVGKSSLSKEYKGDDDDIDNEDEDEDDGLLASPVGKPSASIKFRTASMSRISGKSPGQDDGVDPLSKSVPKLEPLTKLSHVRETGSLAISPGKGIPYRPAPENESPSSQTTSSQLELERSESNTEKAPLSRVCVESEEPEHEVDRMKNRVEVLNDIDPLEHTKSVHNESQESSDPFDTVQVPEGNFKVPKNDWKGEEEDDKLGKKKSSTATSESDEMGVGLGLVNNVKLKGKRKKWSRDLLDDNEDDDADNENDNPATLENLASPNSPPPEDYMLMVIYEVAALACDMKMLLRAGNALDMSKSLQQKRADLFRELEITNMEVQAKYEADATDAELNRGVSLAPGSLSPEKTPGVVESPVRGVKPPIVAREASPTVLSASSTRDAESIDSKKTFNSKLHSLRSFSSLSISARDSPHTATPSTKPTSANPAKKRLFGVFRRSKE